MMQTRKMYDKSVLTIQNLEIGRFTSMRKELPWDE